MKMFSGMAIPVLNEKQAINCWKNTKLKLRILFYHTALKKEWNEISCWEQAPLITTVSAEAKVQKLNYGNFVSVMAEMIKKYGINYQ